MNLEEISTGLRMLAMGRANHPTTAALAEALARVLATPEERLALTVQDEPVETVPEPVLPAAIEAAPSPSPGVVKKRGRPPKEAP